MRARRAFGVVLYTECGSVFQTYTFNRIIIQVQVCYFYIGVITDCFRINTKPMVLCGNFTLTGDDIFYRVVKSAVAMVHFKSGYIIGKGQ